MADWDPTNCKDASKLRSFMVNVKSSRPDLYEAAFRQLTKVEGGNLEDPIELEFWRAVAALEQVYLETSGKKKRANRIRGKASRDGVRKTLEYLALKKEASDGFVHLTEAGLAELTAEYIVARHPTEFAMAVVEAARTRLLRHSIDLSDMAD